MLPKAAEPKLPLGCANSGVLKMSKTSARNSISASPAIGVFHSARSRSRYAGPRAGLRDAVPMVNCGAVGKAAVLMKRRGRALTEGDRFGFRQVRPLQRKSRKGIVVRGLRDGHGHSGLHGKIVFSYQPPRRYLRGRLRQKRWPCPAGRCRRRSAP